MQIPFSLSPEVLLFLQIMIPTQAKDHMHINIFAQIMVDNGTY